MMQMSCLLNQVCVSVQSFGVSIDEIFYFWPMKWTLVAFVASVLAGYCVYDEFDPGTLSYEVTEYICSKTVVYLCRQKLK